MKKYLTAIVISLLLIRCGGDDATFTVEVIDGVRHVHNHTPQWGNEPKVKLEFVQKIGELEGEDENYLFYHPGSVVRDSSGNIYVVDTGNCRIQVFNENGVYLKTIGRKGQGPGEFELPRNLFFHSDGNLYVGEPNYSRIIVLSPEGKEIRRINLDNRHDIVRFMRSGRMVMPADVSEMLESQVMVEDAPLASLLDVDGSLLKEFGHTQNFDDVNIYIYANLCDFALDSGDNIYLTMFFQNRIEKYTPGGDMVFHADRVINFEPKYGLDNRQIEAGGQTFNIPVMHFTLVSWGIAIDPDDRVWVRSYKKETEFTIPRELDEEDDVSDYLEFQLYDTDGVWLDSVPAPQEGSPVIIGDRLFLVDTDMEMCVYEYKIVEK
ncbi:NHL repeat-containing protein [candidate division KSB1 bacterium]